MNMENNKLPNFCYSTDLSSGETILIKFGEKGYWPSKDQRPAEELNKKIGVTKAQAEAMSIGSLCGFDVPGANPDMYDEEGMPIPSPFTSEFLKQNHKIIREAIKAKMAGTSLFEVDGIWYTSLENGMHKGFLACRCINADTKEAFEESLGYKIDDNVLIVNDYWNNPCLKIELDKIIEAKPIIMKSFFDYLKVAEDLDCELIIGDVEMPASFVWDDECLITEAGYEKFKPIMDAEYKVLENGNIEIFCDDDELGEQFSWANAGYVSEKLHNSWFTGEWAK